MSATLSLSSSTYRPSLLAPHHRAQSYPYPAVPVSGHPRGSQGRSMQDPASELLRISLPETVWKFLRTGQPPHHNPRHRRVNEGLSGGTQPLVVFGHPPVVADPREGALHHPSPRQHPETPRRHEALPVQLLALLGPLPGPALGHLLGDRLLRLAHHLDAHAEDLLCPPPAPTLVARVYPQMREAPKATAYRLQKQPYAVSVGHLGAVDPRLEHQALGVHQEVPFSTFHLLGGVEAALVASHPGGLDRLGVHYACAGLGIPARPAPHAFAQRGVQALPRAVDAPSPEPVVDGLPRRELAGQHAPRTTALQDVEDGIEDRPQAV